MLIVRPSFPVADFGLVEDLFKVGVKVALIARGSKLVG